MVHPDGRATTVPVHSGRDVPKGTLRGILRDVELNLGDLDLSRVAPGQSADAPVQVVAPDLGRDRWRSLELSVG